MGADTGKVLKTGCKAVCRRSRSFPQPKFILVCTRAKPRASTLGQSLINWEKAN